VKRVVELVGDGEEAFDQDEPEADPCRYARVAAAHQLLVLFAFVRTATRLQEHDDSVELPDPQPAMKAMASLITFV
jgi:hypothetical protein